MPPATLCPTCAVPLRLTDRGEPVFDCPTCGFVLVPGSDGGSPERPDAPAVEGLDVAAVLASVRQVAAIHAPPIEPPPIPATTTLRQRPRLSARVGALFLVLLAAAAALTALALTDEGPSRPAAAWQDPADEPGDDSPPADAPKRPDAPPGFKGRPGPPDGRDGS